MINLFHLPQYNIDTRNFDNLLHGSIVTEFEERFADYVGAKYAVSFNSATSALFIICREILHNDLKCEIKVPAMIPYVVPNAIFMGGVDEFEFIDDINWVGSHYQLAQYSGGVLIDSAQHVEKDQYKNMKCSGGDMIMYSFYPTKPIGSIDGGMVVTNDEELANKLRMFSMNGMSQEKNNWERKLVEPGYKMYMNSVSAWVAYENLKKLPRKQHNLSVIAHRYNEALGYTNTSHHLYRIIMLQPGIRDQFIIKAKAAGITCGIHYHTVHKEPFWLYEDTDCPQSEAEAAITVSIPFHENLTLEQVSRVIEFVKQNDGSTK